MTKIDASTELTSLQTLIKVVEAGDWLSDPARSLFGPKKDPYYMAYRAFHGSLDAAKVLHEALLPGYGWGAGPWGARVWLYSDNQKWDGSIRQEVDLVDAPARAWLLAILKAYQAQGGVE